MGERSESLHLPATPCCRCANSQQDGGAASGSLCDFRWVQPRLEARKWGLGINRSFDPSLKGTDSERLLPPGVIIELQLSGNTGPPGHSRNLNPEGAGWGILREEWAAEAHAALMLQWFSFTPAAK